ncbi:lipopolysaccharide biosynthesis protein [Pseudomonas oryzihabitans]|uniref:lipopolysaccharide biosynthesis protein n=1 Tax=Pseudomonas oryzihabitans TaxID=47885 RepID=UPI002895F0BF|nr:lipopolysaccharide biosynthesis protein [Pseudomonas oryzihabitans]MDT3720393.1 lipopolysaccharide biosynthesis protein [Pseudomonas oryzihabitans]
MSSASGSFAAWRNRYRGPVLLLASGPSAGALDLAAWQDTPLITMNGAIAKLAGSALRPLFYVCSDLSFAVQQPDLYRQGLDRSTRLALWPEAIQALPTDLLAKAHALHRAPATRLEHHLGVEQEQAQRASTLFSRRARDIGFSRDLDYGIFDVRTVAFIALQLAYHLGFSEIYLAGVDLDTQAPRFYEDGRIPASPCGEQHLHSRILPGLQVMQTVMQAAGRRVFNLSTRSRIPAELIPRVDLAAIEARWLARGRRQAG